MHCIASYTTGEIADKSSSVMRYLSLGLTQPLLETEEPGGRLTVMRAEVADFMPHIYD